MKNLFRIQTAFILALFLVLYLLPLRAMEPAERFDNTLRLKASLHPVTLNLPIRNHFAINEILIKVQSYHSKPLLKRKDCTAAFFKDLGIGFALGTLVSLLTPEEDTLTYLGAGGVLGVIAWLIECG